MSSHSSTSRLSIEVPTKTHKQIKTIAALNGLTVKDFVLSCLNEVLFSSNNLNKETLKAFEETDKGKGLITCKDVGDLFEKLGAADSEFALKSVTVCPKKRNRLP